MKNQKDLKGRSAFKITIPERENAGRASEEAEKVSGEGVEALKLILNDYCEKVLPGLFRNSASISAKKENIVSYPTHVTYSHH